METSFHYLLARCRVINLINQTMKPVLNVRYQMFSMFSENRNACVDLVYRANKAICINKTRRNYVSKWIYGVISSNYFCSW